MSTTKFVLNETSYFGNGAREVLAEEITKRGFKKVFLVSDKSLVEAGVAAKVETELKKANIEYTLYSEIKPNPTIKNVLKDFKASLMPVELDCKIECLPSRLEEVAVVAPNELFEGFFVAKIRKE